MRYLLDPLVVIIFVLAGRATHEDGFSFGGTLQTLWPFLVGLLVGWLLARAVRWPLVRLPAGTLVWLSTLGVGMGLRAMSGQGTALPFVVVATLVLAAGLIGWRLVARLAAGRDRRALS